MFKTDAHLLSDVLDELRWDRQTGSAGIGVAVMGGVVSLFGEVATEAEKRAAIAAAERVSAVRGIAEHLVIASPAGLPALSRHKEDETAPPRQ